MGFYFFQEMAIEELYDLFLKYPDICTDTRKITQNCIYFALKGNNFDGNNFAEIALQNGAALSVVDKNTVVKNNRYLLVDDVLSTLQKLANYHRKKLGIPIIGITGTNGKTTTKELTTAILSGKYNVSATAGNLNNHIGVPLTLLKMNSETEIGIVEMGANHPGEIHDLCNICDPDFGIITNVGKAHLEGFGSFEGVVKTKSELYRFIEKKKGTIFINSENEILKSVLPDKIEIKSYGVSPNAGLKGEIVNQTPFLNIKACFPKEILYLNSNLIGTYNFENIMAAACIGVFFNVDPLLIQKTIKNYRPENNRSQLIKTKNNIIIMDAYNANPTSMQASVTNFLSMEGESKCLILGDMLELGKDSLNEHQLIVDLTRQIGTDKVFLVGKNFNNTIYPDNFQVFTDSPSLTEYLRSHPVKGYLILIKGSRGIQLEKVLENL
ncbi:MAG: UDP-N-acetylmuramoyl-tripeptide--D-alanyl-D-alanine ligase [Prolixibacteraceae bacterium]|nr:UDP-N-acetylmuramoyl-tripeptide--D-alanyl-D-alanine ligase [Prolixibacteraceae bacterium]